MEKKKGSPWDLLFFYNFFFKKINLKLRVNLEFYIKKR
jgi:hypothetical protein